ncbi:MAG TPA: tyrosinase family protein, partial [Paracoccus sp. (in: a-proteobacteria)]|nr:tyrosinase family protein [Paracoccus sp. (in: a-proteobacteria)]
MAGVRKDLASLGGPWSAEILWYARAVRALRSRDPADATSWTYLAAIHGIDPDGWAAEGIISSTQSLPPSPIRDTDFNQCQHAGWFFLPWHRGYLAAFEAILADWIAAQPGGPADWALPYWNYLDDGNPAARDIPPEFLADDWPDGPDNPLRAPRGGTPVLGPQQWLPRDISLRAQTTPMPYTAAPGTVGYGGAISGFSSEGDLTGAVEGNPHNTVHVMIGGIGVGAPPGWMSDPAYAALDPVFWLHHCNIDRLWAAWMSSPANVQEDSPPWRNGPFPRQFVMPDPSGARVVF